MRSTLTSEVHPKYIRAILCKIPVRLALVGKNRARRFCAGIHFERFTSRNCKPRGRSDGEFPMLRSFATKAAAASKVFVINSGSSSLKFKLFDSARGEWSVLSSGLIERIGEKESIINVKVHVGAFSAYK